MQKETLNVIIIGAGTGGLALAHGLTQAGIGVTVFERDRIPRDARGGYHVGISPAGSHALKTCQHSSINSIISSAPRCRITHSFVRLVRRLMRAPAASFVRVRRRFTRGWRSQIGESGVSRQVEVTRTSRAYFVSGRLPDNFRIAIRFRVPSNCHAQPDSPVAHAAGSEGDSFPCRNLDKLPAM
jgi:choline dehydrogenase-like flavoprotein